VGLTYARSKSFVNAVLVSRARPSWRVVKNIDVCEVQYIAWGESLQNTRESYEHL
jgi:hypothetical protein